MNVQDFVLMNKTLCGTVFGSCNPRADIPVLARLYEAGRLQLDEMISRTYRLDDINSAYDDLRNGEIIVASSITARTHRASGCDGCGGSLGRVSVSPFGRPNLAG
jgi:D-arabinose 1-dehydrogenase-like Zn-dependent alcohol dehydrogenase